MCGVDGGGQAQANAVAKAVKKQGDPMAGIDLTERFTNKPRENQLPSARNFTPFNGVSLGGVGDITKQFM